ncbi:MAG: RNA polymerase sigma factor [Bacteroidota bacterium]
MTIYDEHSPPVLTESADEIFEQYHRLLLSFIRSRVAMQIDAEDILSEVWFKFSEQHKKQQLENVKAWLYQVARHKIIDHYRKIYPQWLEDMTGEEEQSGEWQERSSIDIYEEYDEDPIDPKAFWESLYEALDQLPEKQREVFILHELEGLTLQEIADEKTESLKTIISRKGYAIKKLRTLMEDWDEEEN